jgi:hypothetical protein
MVNQIINLKGEWKEINKKRNTILLLNKELNKCIMIDKKPFWATQEYCVELYTITPWDRISFKWFKIDLDAHNYAIKLMEELK